MFNLHLVGFFESISGALCLKMSFNWGLTQNGGLAQPGLNPEVG